MRRPARIAVAVLVSGFVAGTVQNLIGVALKATEEFIAAIMFVTLLALVGAVIFGVALARGRSVAAIDRSAPAMLILLAAALVLLEAASIYGSGSIAVLLRDWPTLAETFLPGFLVILIQWWIVRRHWSAHPLHAGTG
jgi:hypothetical protein